MADRWTKEKRSEVMRRIKSTDTLPELKLRSALHRLGFRFRLHKKDLPGRPDIVLSKYRTAIFVHGCFWHQHVDCKDGHLPKSSQGYWHNKLARTVERDRQHQLILLQMEWTVIVVWECEIEVDIAACVQRIVQTLGEPMSDHFKLKNVR